MLNAHDDQRQKNYNKELQRKSWALRDAVETYNRLKTIQRFSIGFLTFLITTVDYFETF